MRTIISAIAAIMMMLGGLSMATSSASAHYRGHQVVKVCKTQYVRAGGQRGYRYGHRNQRRGHWSRGGYYNPRYVKVTRCY